MVGMPLFFIAISPYGNKDEKDRAKAGQAFEQMKRAAQGLVNGGLDDEEGVAEDEDSVESQLYDLYLTKATVDVPLVEHNPAKEFMAIDPTPSAAAAAQVTYQDLLDAYLEKVEYMIDVEKDYFNALIELDKVMVIAPSNAKAQYLRTKLKQKLKEELDKLKRKRSQQPEEATDEVTNLKERALLEAERRLLTESLIPEKPFEAKVAAEKGSEQPRAVPQQQKEEPETEAYRSVIEPVKMMPAPRTEDVPQPAPVPPKAKPRREVVIVKGADLIKVKALPKAAAVEAAPVENMPSAPVVPAAVAETVVENVPVAVQMPVMLETPSAATVPSVVTAPSAVTAPPVVSKKKTARSAAAARARKTAVLEDQAEKYLLRGKQSFREGNLALALISFSKAKHCDIQGQHMVEIEQLITMTRDRLEALAAEEAKG